MTTNTDYEHTLTHAQLIQIKNKAGIPIAGAEEIFLAYLESQRRQKIAELRDIEKHLIQYGRISKSALRPPRER